MNYYVKQTVNDCVFGPFQLEELCGFLNEKIFHDDDLASKDRLSWIPLPQLIQNEPNLTKKETADPAVSGTPATIRLTPAQAVQLRPVTVKKPAVVLPDSMRQNEPQRPRIVLGKRDH